VPWDLVIKEFLKAIDTNYIKEIKKAVSCFYAGTAFSEEICGQKS
jgi:hypothetical protein